MKIIDIADLHKSIEIARYALAHIGAKFEDDDVDIANKTLTKAAHIMNKILCEVSRQKKSRMRTMLKWTNEPPTKEGWYWLRELDKTASPKMVLVQQEKDGLYMIGPWELTRWALKVLEILGEWEWAGPIPEPVEPDRIDM